MSLAEKIESGKFIVLGEFEPPKGADFSPLLENADRVKGRLDALVIPEMANAVMKASSLGGCAFLQQHGFETVFQVCCRDRNRLALQADILSAGALGVPNIMAVPGEDIRFGDHPQARDVFDLDLIQLLEVLRNFSAGKDMAGVELAGAPRFCPGSSIAAGAMGGALDIELKNLEKMIGVGLDGQQILFLRYSATGRKRESPLPALPGSQTGFLEVDGYAAFALVEGDMWKTLIVKDVRRVSHRGEVWLEANKPVTAMLRFRVNCVRGMVEGEGDYELKLGVGAGRIESASFNGSALRASSKFGFFAYINNRARL